MSKKIDKILDGVPQATREEVEIGKFVHDAEQGKWRQIEGLLNEALLLGKFRGTAPPTISETGFYPLRINSSGELEVSISATSALNINVEDVETLLTDIKAIFTFTGDDLETVIDGLKTQIDALKTQIDKFTFDGSNNLKIVAG